MNILLCPYSFHNCLLDVDLGPPVVQLEVQTIARDCSVLYNCAPSPGSMLVSGQLLSSGRIDCGSYNNPQSCRAHEHLAVLGPLLRATMTLIFLELHSTRIHPAIRMLPAGHEQRDG
jgi:hypothetical protein